MIQNREDFKLGLGLIAFCLFLLVYLIPRQVGPFNDADALMPGLVTGFILLLSILLVVQAVRRPVIREAHTEGEGGGRQHHSSWLSIAVVVVIMAAYAWLLEITGFVLTSMGAMTALFLVFGVRRWQLIAAISLGTLGGLYVCFDILLGAPLPLGTLVENLLE